MKDQVLIQVTLVIGMERVMRSSFPCGLARRMSKCTDDLCDHASSL